MGYEPIVPKGQHLGTSHNVNDAVTGHLFDDKTNELKGHAAWRKVDDSAEEVHWHYHYEAPRQLTKEEIEQAAQVAGLILVGVLKTIQVVTPHVRSWWQRRFKPATISIWRSARAIPRKIRRPNANEIESAVSNSSVTMTPAEWEARIQALLAANAFQKEQILLLSNALVTDGTVSDGKPLELNAVQVSSRLQEAIEANPLLLQQSASASLYRSIGAPPQTD